MLIKFGNRLINTDAIAHVEYKQAERESQNSSLSVYFIGIPTHVFFGGKEADDLWSILTASISGTRY